VWWPAHDQLTYGGDPLPVWDTRAKAFTDPDTQVPLPTWDEACAELTQSGVAALWNPTPRRPALHDPGRCKGKAHKPEHLGITGRRVLISREWSNKTLTYRYVVRIPE
jgi:hypothetical protein